MLSTGCVRPLLADAALDVDLEGRAMVRSSAELVAALSDERINSAHLVADILLAEDFPPDPIRLSRSFTIDGGTDDTATWHVLDLAYLRDKVQLDAGVELKFTHVVLNRFRSLPLFQYPGFDIIFAPQPGDGASSGSGRQDSPAAGRRMPMITLEHGAFLQRPCLPLSLLLAGATFPTYPDCPLNASYLELPQRGCVDDTSAPPMTQCWKAKVIGQTALGHAYSPVGTLGVARLADYGVCGRRAYQLCASLMDEECIALAGGIVACYYLMAQQDERRGSLGLPLSSESVVAGGGVGTVGGGGGGDSDGSNSKKALVTGLLAGALGGAALLLLLGGLAVYLVRRRRLGRADDTSERPAMPEQAGSKYKPSSTSCGMCDSRSRSELATTTLCLTSSAATSMAVPKGDNTAATARQSALPKNGPTHKWLLAQDPITPYTPYNAGIDLSVTLDSSDPVKGGHEGADGDSLLVLTGEVLGKGSHGRVVKGIYKGQPVAAKFVNTGLYHDQQQQQQQQAAAAEQSVRAPQEAGVALASEDVYSTATAGEGSGSRASPEQAEPENRACREPRLSCPLPPDKQSPKTVPAASCADLAGGTGTADAIASALQPTEAVTAESDRPGVHAALQPVARTGNKQGSCQERALRQEVEVLARCQHPNVVRLLAASLSPPQLCLVMELMDMSLERYLYDGGGRRLELPLVLHIASQVASALAYLHPTVLHRDLKPGNILLSRVDSTRPIVKLADFGVSRLLTTVLVTGNPEVGTVRYMANETFDLNNNIITDRVDIFSLAVVMWEMLAGQRPWGNGSINIVALAYRVSILTERPPLAGLCQQCPYKLVRLISSMWAPDPAQRPSAAEIVKKLALIEQEWCTSWRPARNEDAS